MFDVAPNKINMFYDKLTRLLSLRWPGSQREVYQKLVSKGPKYSRRSIV